MAIPQFKTLFKGTEKRPQFWVAFGDDVLDEPMPFDEIKAMVLKYPDWEISILPEDEVEADKGDWTLVRPEDVDISRKRPPGPIESMRRQIQSLSNDLREASRVVEILREYVSFDETYEARKAELDEREHYLQTSEEALMQKAHDLEEMRAELDHRDEHPNRVAQSA